MSDTRPLIHWVSPLPPAETDIAHYTRRILPELSERADLILWTDSTTWDKELETFCSVRHFSPDRINPGQMAPFASEYTRPGAVFVHIGNSWLFHAGLLALARRIPSVVVLHDLAIQEMLFDAIQNNLLDRDTYLMSMRRWYGAEGQDAAERCLSGAMSATELAQQFPGFEIAMEKTCAMLTHTPAASEAVSARRYVPAYELELPFRATGRGSALRSMAGPLRFVQFGHIGPNRRLEQVLEALAGMGTDFDFVFDIVGKVWDADLIHKRCAELGISSKVRQHGYIAESDLDALIAQAHLVFNLRHPTMGEASGSQLRIWNAAAASVVTDQGWYHHLPKDAVAHIPLDGEVSALQNLIAKFEKDRRFGQALGVTGRTRLIDRHSPAHYADGIIEVARAFENDSHDMLISNAARRLLFQSVDTSNSVELKRDRLARLLSQ